MNHAKLFSFLLLIYLNYFINCFNLSPQPNSIIIDPQLKTSMPKYESSYFGYTLLLRSSSIFVGAPRAQSTLESQSAINETGAIYRCNVREKTCQPYIFEDQGDVVIEDNDFLIKSEYRSFQWLGAAMDGGPTDDDTLITCAPRLTNPYQEELLMTGLCYWVNNTRNTLGPDNIEKISMSLRNKNYQVRTEYNKRAFYYMLAEQGFSVHMPANSRDILIGAPGLHTWKGSVLLHRKGIYQSSFDHIVAPNPENFKQPSDSFLGYSVSSGYFLGSKNTDLMYLASAPQANEQAGEAYIYDYTAADIIKHYVFRGKQFGEYFGYAVLGEDINGDGLTDVIVSAPQHNVAGSFDDGAIYVFLNQGAFNFLNKLIISPVIGKSARFGTTITTLGDINRDGYNDIAVAAPFDENGCVFVYLGSEKGLQDQPSQHFRSPIDSASIYGMHMFGHGLAKGNDIDANGFNDFAIGAPNAEAVFVYRAYPVVKIKASINSNFRQITSEQKELIVTICYGIETASKLMKNQDLALHAILDRKLKRVQFNSVNSNEMKLTVNAGTERQCKAWQCRVENIVRHIFKPIELELHYKIIRAVPDSAVFCEQCAAVDPTDPKQYIEKLSFSTDCGLRICEADLIIKSRLLNNSFMLGSSGTITVTYEISNHGETAYLPQINVSSSNHLTFNKIPSNCKLDDNNAAMICDLFNGRPMPKNAKDNIIVTYDGSNIDGGTQIALQAKVSSAGRELTPKDNQVLDYIKLIEYTEIEVTGATTRPNIDLNKVDGDKAEVQNVYEIKSHGPSQVDSLEIHFYIPVAYTIPVSKKTIAIIDKSSIKMKAVLENQFLNINFYQNDMPFSRDDASKYTASTGNQRRRREIDPATANKAKSLDVQDTLPQNRTFIFSCNNASIECINFRIPVLRLKPNRPIIISMIYDINLAGVNAILVEPWKFLVTSIDLNILRPNNTHGGSFVATKKLVNSIIWNNIARKISFWILIFTIIAGILILAILTTIMHQIGFFKRAKKEQMQKMLHKVELLNNAEALQGKPNTSSAKN